jgi:autotransporter translocation and assembly factor TamB
MTGENIVFSEQPVERIELTADLDGEKAHIRPLRVVLSQNQEALRAGGWVSLFNKTYDLKAVSEGISFKHIQAVQKQALGEGMIRLDLSGKGNFANPHLSGEIRMTDLQLKGKPVDDVRFTVDLKDHLARISGGLNFNMDAQYHLESKDFSTELRFDSTDLIPYFRLGGQTELSGILSGVIRAQGNAAAPDQIQGLADISRLEVFMEKTPLIQSQELTAAYKNKGFSVPGIRLALLEKGYVTISGTGNLGGNLNIMARGEIPVEVLQFFVKDIQDAAGQVGLSADIKGTLGEPDIQARIDLKDIGMTLPALSQKLHHLNGGITIDPHGLGIKDVAGQLDEGRFNLSGGVQLDHFKPVHADLSIHADRLPIRMPDTLDLLLNTDLTVRGSADKALISGEIVMIEGNYTRDVKMNLLGMVSQKTRKQAPDEKSSNPALKNIALEIVLKHRNAFVVDNNLALMNLKPSIRIGGTAAQPRVDGRAEVTSGTITFQKKEFEIKKGVIDFLNPYKIEPTIDIQGEIPIRKWIVSLLISGTPDDLRFRLSSDPPEEDADILSLIALGKTTKELISGQGGTSGSTTQMLADILASNLQQNLKSATGLDSVELKYRDGADGQDAGVQVTVGKELSRRLSVKYGVENKDGLSVQKATTEYKFFENLIMSAFQDTQGIFGGELIFRLEFR